MKIARMADVKRIIAHGGLVRFSYKTLATLVSPNGEIRYQLDGRTYESFLKLVAPQLSRTESGSAKTKDLVIEWKQPPSQDSKFP